MLTVANSEHEGLDSVGDVCDDADVTGECRGDDRQRSESVLNLNSRIK